MDAEWWVVVVIVVFLIIFIIILLVVLSVNRQPPSPQSTNVSQSQNFFNIDVQRNVDDSTQSNLATRKGMAKISARKFSGRVQGRPPRQTSIAAPLVTSQPLVPTVQKNVTPPPASIAGARPLLYFPERSSMDNSMDGGLTGDLFEPRGRNVHMLNLPNRDGAVNSPMDPLPFEHREGSHRIFSVTGNPSNGGSNIDFNALTQGNYGGYGNSLDMPAGGSMFQQNEYSYMGVLDSEFGTQTGNVQDVGTFRELNFGNDLATISPVDQQFTTQIVGERSVELLPSTISPTVPIEPISTIFHGRRELTSIPIGGKSVLMESPSTPILPVEDVSNDSDNDKKVTDVIGYSNAVIYLFQNGDIIREDNARVYVQSNLKIERLEVFAGDIYGIHKRQLYRLNSDDFGTNSWHWYSDDIINSLLGDDASTNIIHISTTFDGKYLWIQTETSGFLLESDSAPKLLSKEVYTRHLRRYYAADKDTFTEVDTVLHKLIAYPSGQRREGVVMGVVDHTNKLHTIAIEDVSKYVSIKIVKWLPYYIDR